VSPAGDSLLETMSHAADALQCRVAAGRSQLTSAVLASDIKQSVIDDATARMTRGAQSDAQFAVCFGPVVTELFTPTELLCVEPS